MIFKKFGKFEKLTFKMDNLINRALNTTMQLGTTFQPSNTFKKARIELVKKHVNQCMHF